MSVQCGNPRHPAGAWHEAQSTPPYRLRTLLSHLRRAARRRRYGCECPPDALSSSDIRARRILRNSR